MKKSKKSLAVVLVLSLVITMLSACTSTGNTGGSDSKPTTTEAPQPTEVVTTTEVEPTEEPVVTEEPTEEPEVTTVQEEDVIIRLTSRPFDITTKDPSILLDWEEFWMYYALVDANAEYNGHTLYRIDSLDTSEWTVPCYPDATQTCSLDVLFTDQSEEYTQVCYVVDGEYKLISNFIPLFYNVTQGYLVGVDLHAEYADPVDALCYVSFDSNFKELLTIHLEDPSPYL